MSAPALFTRFLPSQVNNSHGTSPDHVRAELNAWFQKTPWMNNITQTSWIITHHTLNRSHKVNSKFLLLTALFTKHYPIPTTRRIEKYEKTNSKFHSRHAKIISLSLLAELFNNLCDKNPLQFLGNCFVQFTGKALPLLLASFYIALISTFLYSLLKWLM